MSKVKLKRKIKSVKITMSVGEALTIKAMLGQTNGTLGFGLYQVLDDTFPLAPYQVEIDGDTDTIDLESFEQSTAYREALKEYS